MSRELDCAALLAHPANGGLLHVAGPENGSWAGVDLDPDLHGRDPVPDPGHADPAPPIAVFTTALPDAPWKQDALIRRARDRGYRILVVPGASAASAGARELTRRFDMTLLAVEEPAHCARACWQLEQSSDALALDYVRSVAAVFQHEAADLSALFRHISSSIGHAAALVDRSGSLVDTGEGLPDGFADSVDFDAWVTRVNSDEVSAVTVRVQTHARTGIRLVIYDRGLADVQLRALETMAEVVMPAVAARITLDELAALTDASASSELLREFLELRGARSPEVERRMAERAWRTAGYQLGFAFRGIGRTDAHSMLRAVSQKLGPSELDSRVTILGRSAVGWVVLGDDPSAERVEATAARLRAIHDELRRSWDAAMGIGSLQSGESGLRTTVTEAVDAAKVAVNRASAGYRVRVDSLGLDQLLLAWTSNDTFLPAAESLLSPLMNDSQDLLQTLTIYLDQESVVNATAAAMGIHRNTVSMRIHRVQQLLGVDFADPRTRMALHLACHAVLGD